MKTVITLAAGSALALSAGLAMAQQDATTAPMGGMDHSTMQAADGAGSGAMDAYMTSMEDMMTAMVDMEATGDADIDFLLMMIPHHQSAVDMSEALLREVEDPEVRALAEAVIATQEAEIASMRAMLERLGHPVE